MNINSKFKNKDNISQINFNNNNKISDKELNLPYLMQRLRKSYKIFKQEINEYSYRRWINYGF